MTSLSKTSLENRSLIDPQDIITSQVKKLRIKTCAITAIASAIIFLPIVTALTPIELSAASIVGGMVF